MIVSEALTAPIETKKPASTTEIVQIMRLAVDLQRPRPRVATETDRVRLRSATTRNAFAEVQRILQQMRMHVGRLQHLFQLPLQPMVTFHVVLRQLEPDLR